MIDSIQPCAFLVLAALATVSASTEPNSAEPAPQVAFEIDGVPARALEAQANTYQSSLQDSAAIASSPRGDTVVVWQSRRQEDFNYAIYAQRFGSAGERLGGEVRVNAHAPNAQREPAVALDAGGAAWFAWESYAQDGDAGGIVARRFDRELATATSELVVNDEHAGSQAEVALAADPTGRAVVAWTSPGEIAEQRVVRARRLSPDGSAAGPSFQVAGGAGSVLRNPTVAIDAQGRFAIAWSRADAAGKPTEIRVRSYDAQGRELGGESVLATRAADSTAMPIEPVIAFDPDGRLTAAWLVAHGENYVPALRRAAWDGETLTWCGGDVVLLPTATSGYISALDLALTADGRALLVTNHHQEGEVDVVGRFVGLDGSFGEARALTLARAGEQAIDVGGGPRRVALRADGGLALAWSGAAGHGDKSGVHVTMLLPASFAAGERSQDALAAHVDVGVEPRRFVEEEGAAPHEPPIRDLEGAIRREDFPLDQSLSVSGPDFGFLGITQTNLTPPDPHIAVGPNHVAEVVNSVLALFTKSGTQTFTQALAGGAAGFWGSTGAPANAFVFDPEVLYDLDSNRFFVMSNERTGGQSFFNLAVSDDDDPNGTWFKYRFLTPAALGDIDSPNISVGAGEVYLSADFFGPDRYFILIVDKAPLLVGAAPTTASTTITGTQSHGIAMPYSPAPAQYLVEALEAPSNNSIRLHAIQNPLSSPTIVTFTLPVPTYTQPEDPPQLGTTARPNTFEARFWSCMFRNGSIWATHHQGNSRVLQRWYEIDMQGWPTSGFNPVLVQTGDVDPGPGVRTFFGSIAVDAQDNVGLVFARSSPTEFISMSRAFRFAGDPAGTLTPAVVMQASTSPDTSGRWGDYSAVVADPLFDGVFWAGHEFRTSSWATWIGTFGPCEPPTTYCTAKLTSLNLLPAISSVNEPSLGSNSFELAMTNGMPNTTVLYFHGPGPQSTPWFGGTLCVQPPHVRGPATNFDGAGSVQVPFSITPSLVGTERFFQFWFRDPQHPDGTNVGMSDGLRVLFCP